MTVLSPVEKLILYRKKYKISQKELAGESMSRSHLAMIETGKNSLNDHIAAILVENFNKIRRERGIAETIEFENLMETKMMQVEKLKNSFLEKLDNSENLEETVSEIESYASEYDMETKISLYKKIGDLFNEKENYHRAASFYLRIINDLIIIRDLDRLGKISLSLLRIYINIENFIAAVDLENLIKSEVNSFNMPEKIIVLFNFGFIYDSLKISNKALDYFIEVEKYVSNKEKLFDVKNLQALSLADLGRFEEATSIYRSLMLKYKTSKEKLIINDNLLYIAKLENNDEKLKFYYRKCKKLIKTDDKYDENTIITVEQIQHSLGEVALSLNRTKEAINFFTKVCENKTNRNIQLKFNSIKNLLKLYTKKNLNIVEILENLYFELLNREKDLSVGYEFISFYIRENLKKEQENFLEKIKKFY